MSSELKTNLIKALNLKEDERMAFGRCINRLLAETFIIRKFEADKDDYYFIRKYLDQFTAFFDLMDWDLRHDELGAIFQIVNRHRDNLRSLTLRESELLLLLCLTYEEQRALLSLTDFPIIKISDLRQKYEQFLGEQIGNTPLADGLNNLRRYKLIKPLDGRTFDPKSNPEQDIQLLPTLHMVLNVEGLEQVQQMLKVHQKEESMEYVS